MPEGGAVVVLATELTTIANEAEAERLPGSVAATITLMLPVVDGMPLMVRVPGLKINPLAGRPLAVYVNKSPFGSVKAGAVKLNATPAVAV